MKKSFLFLLLTMALMLACNQTPNPEPAPPTPQTPETPQTPKDSTTHPFDTIPAGRGVDTVKIDHYLMGFYKAENFDAGVNKKGYITLSYQYDDYCCYYDRNPGHDNQESERAKKYAELCKRYQDMTYTEVRTFPFHITDYGFRYLMDNITSIDVITETNYNAEHPAGSSLNDICTLEGTSPYKHIKSGYTLTHNWPKAEQGVPQLDKGSIPFTKPLSQCTAQDMILMGNGFYSLCKIKLEKMPTVGSKQLLTIKLKDETGKIHYITTEPFTW